jgi:hypothetical protein
MQDRPDLKIEWLGVVFYAEVKHFNGKEQDQRDEAAMRRSSTDNGYRASKSKAEITAA